MDYQSVINLIPQRARITRQELSCRTGLDDRAVRMAVRAARNAGIPVVSTSREKGYKIAENAAERNVIAREYIKRGLANLMTGYKLKHGNIDGQISIEDLLKEVGGCRKTDT